MRAAHQFLFLFALCFLLAGLAQAQAPASRNLAPGFSGRPAQSVLLLVAPDIELFSMSAGGVLEPRADWTAAAEGHLRAAIDARQDVLGRQLMRLDEAQLDALAEINALHGAVAEAIFVHHMLGVAPLPTKEGRLDWSMGDAIRPLREKTGADYALFIWIRDSYASAERKAAMVAMALFGIGLVGGSQVGYASLVDLQSGRVVWFNHLLRGSGDLREAGPARETLEALLRGLPPVAR